MTLPDPKKVIPIRPYIRLSGEQREIADLAFEFWVESRFRRPEESLLRAVLEVTCREGNHARPGLFLVPKTVRLSRDQIA